MFYFYHFDADFILRVGFNKYHVSLYGYKELIDNYSLNVKFTSISVVDEDDNVVDDKHPDYESIMEEIYLRDYNIEYYPEKEELEDLIKE